MAYHIMICLTMTLIKSVVYTYELVTWPIYVLFRRSLMYMPLTGPSVEEDVKYDPQERRTLSMSTLQHDPTAPWRAVEAMDALYNKAAPGCDSVNDLWLRSVQLYPNNKGFGTRELLEKDTETTESGKKFIKVKLGNYFWETFSEAELRVSRLSAGLQKMLAGAEKSPIAIYSETRCEWMYAAQSTFRLGRTVVTLYATLGDDALIHGLNETEASVMFISDELISKIPNVAKHCPKLKHIIYLSNGVFFYNSNEKNSISRLSESTKDAVIKVRETLPSGVTLIDMVDVEETGKEVMINYDPASGDCNSSSLYEGFWMPSVEERPNTEDLAIIMYTSGSTGKPKGVEITHRSLSSAVAGFVKRLPELRAKSDLYIGYLPLAHVFELACEMTCLFMGVKIGYSNPQTLTDKSTRIKQGACKGDLSVLRPTLFAAVPTVLERISKSVWEKVTDDGPMAKALFKFAYDYKRRRLQAGYPSFLVDRLVFRKVRKLMGGKVRYIISGGAPLSEDSQMFTYVCFAPVIQGYGLTETCSCGALMETGDLRCNISGAPVPSVEIQLRDWPEGGYSPHDKPNPRGEILIGGTPISRGYFKQPELTAKDFLEDKKGRRWFCTGDIGLMHPDGSLSIIDRKKDLVKLQAGEYVSLAKVELVLCQSVYVETVCVYADPAHSFTICFMSPKKKQLREMAKSLNVRYSPEDIMKCSKEQHLSEENAQHYLLCHDKQIIAGVLKDLQTLGREKKLQTFELPQKLYLDCSTWTPESGLVTDALKLKRFNLKEKFKSFIDESYGQPSRKER